jgi:hypothetical protein
MRFVSGKTAILPALAVDAHDGAYSPGHTAAILR